MSYLDQCIYLQHKYSLPTRAYFLTPTCKSKTGTKISRTSEGLIIHHLKENYFPDLSKTEHAILQPWEYQEPQNLVYCNYIEHLILHVHIVQEYLIEGLQRQCLLGIGGIQHIRNAIADLYVHKEYNITWLANCYNAIAADESDFQYLCNLIAQNTSCQFAFNLLAQLETN